MVSIWWNRLAFRIKISSQVSSARLPVSEFISFNVHNRWKLCGIASEFQLVGLLSCQIALSHDQSDKIRFFMSIDNALIHNCN